MFGKAGPPGRTNLIVWAEETGIVPLHVKVLFAASSLL